MSHAQRTGDERTLDKAVRHLREVLAAASSDDPLRGRYLADLGVALRWRFERTGAPADISAAIEAGQSAVRATPRGNADRFDYLNSLLNALWIRYEASGILKHLDEGVAISQQAIAEAPPDHPVRAGMLSALGSALRGRYARTGRLADLDAAIRSGAQAVDACPNESAFLSDLLTTLWESPPLGSDLDSVIRALYRVVYSTPRDHPDQLDNLRDLADGLGRRFGRTRSPDDLDDVIRILGRVVTLEPSAKWFTHLGTWLVRRFENGGALPDLEKAVRVSREALWAGGAHGRVGAESLTNLGSVLRMRFEHTDALADLNEAVQLSADAVQAVAPGAPEQAVMQSNLAITLVLRFARTASLTDLDEAIRMHALAHESIGRDRVERPGILSAHALALQLRFERTGAVADIDEAVRLGTEAAGRGLPSRAMNLANLAEALRVRHGHTGNPADLDQAVLAADEAVRLTPADHSERAKRLLVLGHTLAYRFVGLCEEDDYLRAGEAFNEILRLESAPPWARARAAQRLGGLLAITGNQPSAVRYYETAVVWLLFLSSRHVSRDAQEHRLGSYEGLASDAAACALANGDAERALELLEAGRGVLLAQALETRTDVSELRSEAPELAQRFTFLCRRLDRDERPFEGQTVAQEERSELLAEFGALVTEIRRLPRFGRFLLPEPAAELMQDAAEGPIVLLNTSDHGCHALLLTEAGVRAVPLPGLTREGAHDHAQQFLAAVDMCQCSTLLEQKRAQQSITHQLEWLWDTITEPVLVALGHTAPPAPGQPWPRVWWSPTGPLALLPLHAAGRSRDPRSVNSVLDRVVSSYTPTVGVLRHHRGRPRTRTASPALVVAMPETPRQAALPGAQREHDLLKHVFGEPTSVVGGAATHQRVLDELPRHSIAHFACHGTSDPAHPSASSLLLHDHAEHPLQIPEIARLDLIAELAYLSACETARNNARLADEAIHLAGAFQLAGYANVVGALWKISDDVAVSIAQDFYAYFARSGSAALALHESIRRVRASYPKTPSLWGAHIHSGI